MMCLAVLKASTCASSLSPHSSMPWYLICPFYRWGEWGTVRLIICSNSLSWWLPRFTLRQSDYVWRMCQKPESCLVHFLQNGFYSEKAEAENQKSIIIYLLFWKSIILVHCWRIISQHDFSKIIYQFVNIIVSILFKNYIFPKPELRQITKKSLTCGFSWFIKV